MNASEALGQLGIGDGPLAVVAGHPDDETIGASTVLGLGRAAVVHLTDGCPRDPAFANGAGFTTREQYREARRVESLEALAIPGVDPPNVHCLECEDQEASFALQSLSLQITRLLETVRPAAVLTHPYEGGHADHDAAAFVVHAALALLRRDQNWAPEAIEFTSYFQLNGTRVTGQFLPVGEGIEVVLTPKQREMKQRMFARYPSQRGVLADFGVETERFRRAPSYDFGAPPHPGKLYYEQFSWGMDGRTWRRLALCATDSLRLKQPL